MKKRIVVVAPEPVRGTMAGMGIRALEIARTLSAEFSVRLLTPGDTAATVPVAGVEVVEAAPESPAFAAAARESDAALVSGHAANFFFHAAPGVPVAVDLYDPWLVENFQYLPALGPRVEANDRAAWNLAAARGDFFLCASREQRLFYAGILLQAGRIDAELFLTDPALSGLLSIVPFGVREAAPGNPQKVREAIGAAPGDPVLYWGGLYDWHDITPLFSVWPALLARFPALRLIFAENPNRSSTPQRLYEEAAAVSRRNGWRESSIFFLPWSAYGERANIYASSSLAVCCCRPGLESELSFRTRLLDAAAAGVPSVSIEGGTVAQQLEAAGGGRQAHDAPQLHEAIQFYLSSEPRRRDAGERAREFSRSYTWEAVIRPLLDFFRNPRVSRRLPFPAMPARPRARLLRFGRS